MKKTVICLFIAVLIGLPPAARAQIESPAATPATLLDNPIHKTFSLLDPQRLQIRHSYSLSYFSGGGQSGSVGMYFSRLRYQIAEPLALYVSLGFAHDPSSLWGRQKGGTVNEGFYPGFYLDYRPSPKLHLGIGYQRVPGYVDAARLILPFFYDEERWRETSPGRWLDRK